MSIRFSISATSTEGTEPVRIDAHHIASDGTWFEHPIRSHALPIGANLHLLAHVALGFVLHKGKRDELCLCFTHDDPGASHWLQIVVVKALEAGPDSLPSAISLDAGNEAIEVERVIVPPGGSASITLYLGTHLQIREVLHFRERDGG